MKDQLKIIKEIGELVQDNCHTEAYVESAKMIGNQELVDKFNAILSDQNKKGYLDPTMQKERYIAYIELKEYVKSHLSPAIYKRWYDML